MYRFEVAVGPTGRRVLLAGAAYQKWRDSFRMPSLVIGTAWRAEVLRAAERLAVAEAVKQTTLFVEYEDEDGDLIEETVACIAQGRLKFLFMLEDGNIVIIFITGGGRPIYKEASHLLH